MKQYRTSSGFTLIELLISIGIFAVFIVIISGVFGRFVEVQRHSIEQGVLILEVQSVVEAIIKEARTGYGSTYISEDRGNQLAFRNQKGMCVAYQLKEVTENGKMRRVFMRAEDAGNTSGECKPSGMAAELFVPLSSNGIDVTDVFFDANQAEYDETSLVLETQGVITFVLTAKSTKGDAAPLSMTVQNSVASRQVKAYAN